MSNMSSENSSLSISTMHGVVPVEVLNDGRFRAEIDGSKYLSDRFKDLEATIQHLARKRVRVSVPATLFVCPRLETGPARLDDITVTGIHSGNGSILFTDASGNKRNLDDYKNPSDFLVRLTSEQRGRLSRLLQAYRAAKEAYNAYHSSLELPLASPAVLVAYADKVNEQGTSKQATGKQKATKTAKTTKKEKN